MPSVVFLESLSGTISLFTRGLLTGASRQGWSTAVVPLRSAAGAPREAAAICREATRHRPDAVVFLMDAPLAWPDLWARPEWQGVRRLSLWFDDFMRSPLTLGGAPLWKRWQDAEGVRVAIWDGHWRDAWHAHTGGAASPLHLAADERDFDPGASPAYPDFSDRVTFVGTVPAAAALEADALALPSYLARELPAIVQLMEQAHWPFLPYPVAEAHLDALDAKRREACTRWLAIPAQRAVWHLQLWRWGKRVARLRGLRAVAKQAPLAILSGHRSEPFAKEEELREALPPGTDLAFRDTTHIAPGSWSGLFRSGALQLQVTDPQSVAGGIPFRFFECSACASPLASDDRPELRALWPAPLHGLLAKDDVALGQVAADWRARPLTERIEAGRMLREAFLQKHTWSQRWAELSALLTESCSAAATK